MRRLAAVLVAVLPSTLFAWGNAGHQITAEIADRQLSDQATAQVRKLLKGRQLVDVAVLPDAFKNTEGGQVTRDWHFVDIVNSNATYDAARDCEFDDCIVARIDALKHILGDRTETPARRADARASRCGR